VATPIAILPYCSVPDIVEPVLNANTLLVGISIIISICI
jgi:hypothetical protein